MLRIRHFRIRTDARLVEELERGTPFRAARRRAGVSWWEVFIWCLRGRRRFHSSPFSPHDSHTALLLALADTRSRTGCDLGPVINWLVGAFQTPSSRGSAARLIAPTLPARSSH
jgi:hypothetical protein